MQIIRKVLWSIVLILVLFNLTLFGWHAGYDKGYTTAMADVILHYETPENFFIKKFDIKTPRRLKQ